MNDILVKFNNITIEYILNKQHLKAINNVSLNIEKGKVTAFVGESGSGKTTLVSSLLSCISYPGKITGGEVEFIDKDGPINIATLSDKKINNFRWEKVSMVFQSSQSTLNPLLTIYDQFYETAYYHGKIKNEEDKIVFDKKVEKLLDITKLDKRRILKSYPHQLSGGMKQRVMICFALLLDPELIILDEPTTALDVITQEHIFNQLVEINKTMGITMILLTHDIGVVAKIADNIAVLYAGSVMEYGDVYTIFRKRMHPYTKGLIEATPSLLVDPALIKPIPGNPPDIRNLPTGCPFHERCPKATDKCKTTKPLFEEIEDNHFIACHLYTKEK
ncbi:MAG: ABC transporter ATP-binding protein [Erysipelotrichaceae bacterium]|nr:ABC transporter ATP-binding protein [Erysipelotrichaceae bacterium]